MATCDITQLMEDGKCFLCLNHKQLGIALAQILCDILSVAVVPDPDACDERTDDFDSGVNGQELAQPPWQKFGDFFLYNNGTAIEDPGGDGSNAWYDLLCTNGWVQAACLGTGWHEVMFRADWTVGGHWYGAAIDESSDTICIMRGTGILGSVAATFVAGQVLRLEVDGTRLTAKYNGTTVLVVNDTTGSAISDDGFPGLRGSEDLGAVFDDFACCSTD